MISNRLRPLCVHIATHSRLVSAVSAGGIPPLVAMLGAEEGRGDEDPALDMKEQACKTLCDLCVADAGNQRPIAERGAIPPLLQLLDEASHPWSIKEAAAEALALLAYEAAGGPAQEILTGSAGVSRLLACYRSAGCTHQCKGSIARCLRYLAMYNPAKHEMQQLGVLQPRETDPEEDGLTDETDALLMGHRARP
jgi:hypothetical protein